MAQAIVFYTHPMSRGRVVRWMLEEVGASYRTEIVDFGPVMKTQPYLAINPMGKVPSIQHDNFVVTETAAICAYLADAFPGAGLAPSLESGLRGSYYRWLFFAAGPIEQALAVMACGWATPQEKRGMVGFGCLEDVLNTVEGALNGRDYLVGNAFSTADLYLGAQLAWAMQIGVFEKRPVFERYVSLLYRRPAAIRAAAIDDDMVATAPRPA
jgi:glutathione S-transferase